MAESTFDNNALNSNFYYLDGTTRSDAHTYVDYPTGFNRANTIVIGFALFNADHWDWRDDDAVAYVSTTENNIDITLPNSNVRGRQYRMLLYKLSK